MSTILSGSKRKRLRRKAIKKQLTKNQVNLRKIRCMVPNDAEVYEALFGPDRIYRSEKEVEATMEQRFNIAEPMLVGMVRDMGARAVSAGLLYAVLNDGYGTMNMLLNRGFFEVDIHYQLFIKEVAVLPPFDDMQINKKEIHFRDLVMVIIFGAAFPPEKSESVKNGLRLEHALAVADFLVDPTALALPTIFS